ncbi:unnamed protein product [Gongylonema pulchrum]|uniref:Secreted protein n=1 Tax=Gongylonema pulchrum TaxID=637853 RepID=A0A183EYH3_9BILA|nr:unnamed protein product [Gongylonema pulchrum]
MLLLLLLWLLEVAILECNGAIPSSNNTKIVIRRLSGSAAAPPSNGTTTAIRKRIAGDAKTAANAVGRPKAAGLATNIGAPPISYANKLSAIGATK